MAERPALKIAKVEDQSTQGADEPGVGEARAKTAVAKPVAQPVVAERPEPPTAAKPVVQPIAPTPVVAEPIARPVVAAPPVRKRHKIIIATFFLGVVAPALLAVYYLFAIAVDQYHSRTAFSIRSEEVQNPLEVLSAFTQTGQGTASDIDILHDFIMSQPLVERLNAELDFHEIFRRYPEDIVFSLEEAPPIEDLMRYWERMISVAVDSTTGVVDVQVRAFDPNDAVRITQGILRESSDLINALSQVAQEDKTRFALDNLERAQARLKEIRLSLSIFRSQNQIINPEVDFQGQMNVVGELQTQLAEALVQRETLMSYARQGDPRLSSLDRRINAIRGQIDEERALIATNATQENGMALTDVIGKYEELLVELEFSQDAYVAARALEQQALSEAQRQSRFLAAHIKPTKSVEAQFPQRPELALLIVAGLFAAWAVMVLIYYNVRDRT